MTKKTARYILLVIIAGALIAGITGYKLWTKPHEKAEDISGIQVSATELAAAYTADERTANTKYLNKVLEVKGAVTETDKNQDGGTMIVLGGKDEASGVQCSMREKNVSATKGQEITIKGFCSGNSLMGVSLTDCIIE